MADYIKRKDAYKAIEECWEGSCGEYDASVITHDTIEALDSIPSADVAEVRHGKWVDGDVDGIGACGIEYRYKKCSICDYEYSFPIKYSFCPNCGADMRKDGGT